MSKKKILWLSDHPLVPSGVGTQAKYLIEGLLATGQYQFVCLGGAVKHPDYRPQKVQPEKYGDDWVIFPVDGYGDKNLIRQMLLVHKPDAVFMFTDPRFFVWMWEMEDEVRSVCPLLYWHVWDNDPTPRYNKIFYDSTDAVVPLSLKTYGILQDLGIESRYIPHAVAADIYKPLPEEEVQKFKKQNFGPHADKKFIIFWNNRNARRKMTGDVIASFAKFAEQVGKDKVSLMMHTNVHDQEGQDILAVGRCYDVEHSMILSESRLAPGDLNMFYNVCDMTINIANNEGFGLSTLESLFAGTPLVVHMTGGLQFQIGDWWEELKDFRSQEKLTELAQKKWRANQGNWWGVPVFPASRSCTGSQQVPYIYDDRPCHDEVVKALMRMYKMGREERRALGAKAREWATRKFDLKDMVSSWDQVFQEQISKHKQAGYKRFRVASV